MPTGSGDPLHLTGRRLPRWVPWGIAAAAILLGLACQLTGLTVVGLAPGVIAAIAFLVIQAVASWTVEGRRHATDRLATTLIYATFVLALTPLLWILATVAVNGLSAFSLEFLTSTMRNVSPRAEGGGIAHAFVGTLEQVGIAALIAVPIGILAAVYLVEFGRGRLAFWISFFVDVMTGVPSIVAGLFIYTALILTGILQQSGLAAGLALALLMLPVVIRATEEMLRIVPNELREGALALGVPHWKVIVRIVIPTAISGIITGVMLAVARVAGETAPLLLTTFLAQDMNPNPVAGSQTSLPTFIWDQISRGTPAAVNRAWGGALALILFVLVLYAGARLIARVFAPKAR
ncbi:MAG: phosphate ABC transporter permease PstA [Candidatus Nanopelagicales bacterium]